MRFEITRFDTIGNLKLYWKTDQKHFCGIAKMNYCADYLILYRARYVNNGVCINGCISKSKYNIDMQNRCINQLSSIVSKNISKILRSHRYAQRDTSLRWLRNSSLPIVFIEHVAERPMTKLRYEMSIKTWCNTTWGYATNSKSCNAATIAEMCFRKFHQTSSRRAWPTFRKIQFLPFSTSWTTTDSTAAPSWNRQINVVHEEKVQMSILVAKRSLRRFFYKI